MLSLNFNTWDAFIQFQHLGSFDRVVKHQKYNLKALKATFESIKSNQAIKCDALLTLLRKY